MALSRATRAATRVVPAARAAAAARPMASLTERERAIEKAYFNKQEEQLLRKLLKKVKSQADEADVAAPKHLDTERSKLMHIVSKYSMSSEDIEALIAWRHDDEH